MPRIAIATLCAVLVAGAASSARADTPVDTTGDEGPGPEAALTQKIAVWRLDALGIEAELVARLETLFRSELDRLAKTPLPSRRQMDVAVGKDKTLRECTGEEKCLTTIGQKVGVDVMVTGSVAALGDSYILNIKAVDVKSGKQIRRIASDPLRGSPDELIEAVRVAAYSLLAPEQLYGGIVVLSDLVGGDVKLDGKPVPGKSSKTPLPGPIAKVPLGKHTIEVAAKGYLPYKEEIDVRFQKTTRVVVHLALVKPVAPLDGPPKVVVREPRSHWYTSKWMYVGAGVVAAGVGAFVGWEIGKDTVISCIGTNPDPRCK